MPDDDEHEVDVRRQLSHPDSGQRGRRVEDDEVCVLAQSRRAELGMRVRAGNPGSALVALREDGTTRSQPASSRRVGFPSSDHDPGGSARRWAPRRSAETAQRASSMRALAVDELGHSR